MSLYVSVLILLDELVFGRVVAILVNDPLVAASLLELNVAAVIQGIQAGAAFHTILISCLYRWEESRLTLW